MSDRVKSNSGPSRLRLLLPRAVFRERAGVRVFYLSTLPIKKGVNLQYFGRHAHACVGMSSRDERRAHARVGHGTRILVPFLRRTVLSKDETLTLTLSRSTGRGNRKPRSFQCDRPEFKATTHLAAEARKARLP